MLSDDRMVFIGGLVLCIITIVLNVGIWFLGRNAPKLNTSSQVIILMIIRACVIASIVCFPATLLQLGYSNQGIAEIEEDWKFEDKDFEEEGTVKLAVPDDALTLFTIINAIRYIIFGTIPWLVFIAMANFQVRRSYKVRALQLCLTVSVALVLSITKVTTCIKCNSGLFFLVLYTMACTLLPILFIICNFVFRWRRQISDTTDQTGTRTPIFSSQSISLLCFFLPLLFIPADIITITNRLLQNRMAQLMPHATEGDLVATWGTFYHTITKIAVFFKYAYICIVPPVLLMSREYRSILVLETRKKYENMENLTVKRKRSSTVSISTTSIARTGIPRSFSAVINEHAGCLEQGDHDHSCKHSCNETPASTEEKPGLEFPDLRLNLHILHTEFDANCDICWMNKNARKGNSKKVKQAVKQSTNPKKKYTVTPCNHQVKEKGKKDEKKEAAKKRRTTVMSLAGEVNINLDPFVQNKGGKHLILDSEMMSFLPPATQNEALPLPGI